MCVACDLHKRAWVRSRPVSCRAPLRLLGPSPLPTSGRHGTSAAGTARSGSILKRKAVRAAPSPGLPDPRRAGPHPQLPSPQPPPLQRQGMISSRAIRLPKEPAGCQACSAAVRPAPNAAPNAAAGATTRHVHCAAASGRRLTLGISPDRSLAHPLLSLAARGPAARPGPPCRSSLAPPLPTLTPRPRSHRACASRQQACMP